MLSLNTNKPLPRFNSALYRYLIKFYNRSDPKSNIRCKSKKSKYWNKTGFYLMKIDIWYFITILCIKILKTSSISYLSNSTNLQI